MDLLSTQVFIYCGGKCGSSTLERTFTTNGFVTLRCHTNLEFKKTKHTNINIHAVIDGCKKRRKVYVIDVYRTPIERKISSFFENLNTHVPNYTSLSIEQLTTIFNNKFLDTIEEYHPFDEVMQNMGFKKNERYDFNKKYIKIVYDNIIFIKLRFTDIAIWGNILTEIFGKKIIIHPDNLSNKKSTYNLYNNFKNNYKVPKEYLESLKDKDINFKIYNKPEEQDKYINMWMQRSL